MLKKKYLKWAERINFETYSSCMHCSCSLFLYGSSIPPWSVPDYPHAPTSFHPHHSIRPSGNLLFPHRDTNHVKYTWEEGAHQGCKPEGLWGDGQWASPKGSHEKPSTASTSVLVKCKALQHLASVSVHPSSKQWCLRNSQPHRLLQWV